MKIKASTRAYQKTLLQSFKLLSRKYGSLIFLRKMIMDTFLFYFFQERKHRIDGPIKQEKG